MQEDLSFETLTIISGCDPQKWTARNVTPPIAMTSTYAQDSPGIFHGYDYSRHGNPTRTALEEALAKIENAKYSLAYSSGVTCAGMVLLLLQTGDHIVCVNDLYGGISRIFIQIGGRMGITTTFVDNTKTEEFAKAIQSNTKLIWLESPSNPQLKVCDIEKISKMAHEKNPEIIVAHDNSFLTPYFQRPLELGVDISMSSLTKFTNGHHDTIMGALTMNRKDLYEKLYHLQLSFGAIPSPMDCFLVLRSIHTLPLRLEKHQQNALEIARYLEKHPKVEKVNHPLLESHPQLELTKKQTKGHSGMLSFYLVGSIKNSIKFVESLKIVHITTSLGGCATTVAIPEIMVPLTHKYTDEVSDEDDFKSVAVRLIRMSVGLENVKDLINDLDQALEKAFE